MTDQNPMECPRCHQTHGGCTGHNRAGNPCGKVRMKGQAICASHGGKAPQAIAAAERREALAKAERDVELFAARRDVRPAEALLELVQWTAGEVDYWRQEVRLLEREELTWGVTRVKDGGDDSGTTQEAKPNVAYAMLIDSSNRLERYASSALKAGADAAMVQIARAQGAMLAGVIQRILARLDLTEQQAGLVAVVVPEELRAIAAAPEQAAS